MLLVVVVANIVVVAVIFVHNFLRSLLLQKNLQFYKLVSYNDQVTIIRYYKLAHKDFQLQIEIQYLNEKMEIRSFHLGRT